MAEITIFGKTIFEIVTEIQLLVVAIIISLFLLLLARFFGRKGKSRLIQREYKQSGFFFGFIFLTILVYLILQIWVF